MILSDTRWQMVCYAGSFSLLLSGDGHKNRRHSERGGRVCFATADVDAFEIRCVGVDSQQRHVVAHAQIPAFAPLHAQEHSLRDVSRSALTRELTVSRYAKCAAGSRDEQGISV